MPPAYCISCKRGTYTLLWSWQHVEAVCFNATFLPNGSDKRQWSGRIRQLDVWGPLDRKGGRVQPLPCCKCGAFSILKGLVIPLSTSRNCCEYLIMHEKKYIYIHTPWNHYNFEKYRDTHFWSYRPALLCCTHLSQSWMTKVTVPPQILTD